MNFFVYLRTNKVTVKTNSQGAHTTRPDHDLIIMIGLPGSGKSTASKTYETEYSVTLSIDEVIERYYDYFEFFRNMKDKNDFSPFRKMVNKHIKEFNQHVQSGTKRIIIDNTNLKYSDMKHYVKTALEFGYSDDNIKFINLGTNGFTAKELSLRNKHGVDEKTIDRLINRYNTIKNDITIERIMRTPDRTPLYASVILTKESSQTLKNMLHTLIPGGWDIYAHHMTIRFGGGLPEHMKDDLGKTVSLTATHIGVSDVAIAVKVTGYESMNDIPHVTVAVNRVAGGKPVMSNDITDWVELSEQLPLVGTVAENY